MRTFSLGFFIGKSDLTVTEQQNTRGRERYYYLGRRGSLSLRKLWWLIEEVSCPFWEGGWPSKEALYFL